MIVLNGRYMTQHLTGVQRYARGITRALLRSRHDIEVVVPRNGKIRPEYADIPVTRIGALTGHAWEQVSLPLYARKQDAVLLNLGSTGPALLRKQIVTNHDITYVRYPESFARSFRLLYRALTPVLLRSAMHVITVSEFSKQEISEFFGVDPDKFVVVPNAADDVFQRGQEESHRDGHVLAVSSPSAHKNFARLLDAYSALDGAKPPLVIVGGTAPALVRPELAEDEGVRFAGRVSDDELVRLYRGATAFVFPSLYEGFGIPPLEAQACGVPVVAADIPVTREVLGDSALYADPTSVNSIAEAIHSLLVAPDDLRSRIIELGASNAQRFSWEQSANIVSALLDRAVAEAPGSSSRTPEGAGS